MVEHHLSKQWGTVDFITKKENRLNFEDFRFVLSFSDKFISDLAKIGGISEVVVVAAKNDVDY